MFSRRVTLQWGYTARRTLADLYRLKQKIQCPIKMSPWEDVILAFLPNKRRTHALFILMTTLENIFLTWKFVQ